MCVIGRSFTTSRKYVCVWSGVRPNASTTDASAPRSRNHCMMSTTDTSFSPKPYSCRSARWCSGVSLRPQSGSSSRAPRSLSHLTISKLLAAS